MNEYIRRSKLNGKKYDLFSGEVVRIINLMQSMAYISNGVMPVDIYISKDKNDNPCLVFLFNKEETKEVYDLWCKHELDINIDLPGK